MNMVTNIMYIINISIWITLSNANYCNLYPLIYCLIDLQNVYINITPRIELNLCKIVNLVYQCYVFQQFV